MKVCFRVDRPAAPRPRGCPMGAEPRLPSPAAAAAPAAGARPGPPRSSLRPAGPGAATGLLLLPNGAGRAPSRCPPPVPSEARSGRAGRGQGYLPPAVVPSGPGPVRRGHGWGLRGASVSAAAVLRARALRPPPSPPSRSGAAGSLPAHRTARRGLSDGPPPAAGRRAPAACVPANGGITAGFSPRKDSEKPAGLGGRMLPLRTGPEQQRTGPSLSSWHSMQRGCGVRSDWLHLLLSQGETGH